MHIRLYEFRLELFHSTTVHYSLAFVLAWCKKKKKHILFFRLKYSCVHSVWLKTQRTGKPQKQYTVQRMICILKTGKIWYGFGTMPSGIINTFQPLLCSSHIMLWQASTPPARPLILTHTTWTHKHKREHLFLLLYVCKHC